MTNLQQTCKEYNRIIKSTKLKKYTHIILLLELYPGYNWRDKKLLKNPGITLEYIKALPEWRRRRNYAALSENPNITWEYIQRNMNKSWNFNILCKHRCITWDIILANPKLFGDMNYISQNPNITWDIVVANEDLLWNYGDLCASLEVTVEILDKYIIPWDFGALSMNKSVTFELFKKYHDRDWDYVALQNNPYYTDIYFEYLDKPWPSETLNWRMPKRHYPPIDVIVRDYHSRCRYGQFYSNAELIRFKEVPFEFLGDYVYKDDMWQHSPNLKWQHVWRKEKYFCFKLLSSYVFTTEFTC